MLDSYLALTLVHYAMPLFFVFLLGWDTPNEWPALYGSIASA
jgi:hypothetical protein